MRAPLARGTPWFVGALWLGPLLVKGRWARVGTAALAAGVTWFFRDPHAAPTATGSWPRPTGSCSGCGPTKRAGATISTYLNLLDVHVTRAPCDAVVIGQTYRRGRHHRASSRSAHLNERMEWQLATEHGDLVLTQYAGTVARRIVTYKKTGDRLQRGEPIGLIRFGSRVDVTLPDGLLPTASAGQRMYGGATVVARSGST